MEAGIIKDSFAKLDILDHIEEIEQSDIKIPEIISLLQELKKKYPNWNFTALYTGFDWNYVIRTGKYFWKKFSSKIIFR